MPKVRLTTLPSYAFSAQYQASGAFTDCYYTDLPVAVSLADFIHAFYTTTLFKVERGILSIGFKKPATDQCARLLADARAEAFSIWTVERREGQQILLRELTGSTRSWLMTVPNEQGGTRLYFGSVVIPSGTNAQGEPSFGVLFHVLGGFHRIYSRGLLYFAARKLLKPRSS